VTSLLVNIIKSFDFVLYQTNQIDGFLDSVLINIMIFCTASYQSPDIVFFRHKTVKRIVLFFCPFSPSQIATHFNPFDNTWNKGVSSECCVTEKNTGLQNILFIFVSIALILSLFDLISS
jgi:hypothetical protein